MKTEAELIDWLCDIYAMENAMETALNKLTDGPHHHPVLREQAALHRTETRRHTEAIANCLKRLGSETSSLITVLAQGVGMDLMRSAGTTFARDERIKDVLTVLVTGHFAIACHTILSTSAAQLGLLEIVIICDQIMFEEKRMVKWLQLNLPEIIGTYLAPEEEAEADDETEYDFGLARNDRAQSTERWEFVQLAHNASLFGGVLPRSTFANLQS